jgi:hypothetical protein
LRCGNRYICTSANRNADVGLCQGWSVVDAITNHGNFAAFCLQCRDLFDLVARQQISKYLVDASLLCNCYSGRLVIAGLHGDLEH